MMAADPSRLVTGASGWDDHPVGHVMDVHVYPGPSNGGSQLARGEDRAVVVGEMWGQSKAECRPLIGPDPARYCALIG